MNGLSVCVASKLHAWSQCDRVRGFGGSESGTKVGTFLNWISASSEGLSQMWRCTPANYNLRTWEVEAGDQDFWIILNRIKLQGQVKLHKPWSLHRLSLSKKKKNGSMEHRRGPSMPIPRLETSSLPNGELSMPCLPPVL